jgi:hypothetical protein
MTTHAAKAILLHIGTDGRECPNAWQRPCAAPLNSDRDGMPDESEKKKGLDPAKNDSAKGNTDKTLPTSGE